MQKKLLFFIESLEVGGAEKSLVTLLRSVNLKNFEVDLIMLKKGTFLKEVPEFVNCIFLEELKPSLLQRLQYFILKKTEQGKLHAAQNFWKIYQQEFKSYSKQYDLAISYGQGFATYFVAEKVNGKNKIAWVNTDYRKAEYNALFDKKFYLKYHDLVMVSEAGKKSFADAFKNAEINLKLSVIEDLIDHQNILELAKERTEIEAENIINIVTVGRLHEAKGYDLAIKSAKILRDKGINFKWWIIGEGNQRGILEKLIVKNNLEQSFILKGLDTNPYKYMRAADIYVQTSIFEGFSITVREAKVLNKPIVSTNFPSVHSALKSEENGLIAEMNSEAVAHQIERLILDKSLCSKLVENLRKENLTEENEKIKKIEKLFFGF